MIKSDVIRGHLDTIILKLISERDMYGFEISNEVKTRTNNLFEIKEATLYSAVQRLEKKELIESYIGLKSHGGKRRYYRITTLGKAFFTEKIVEWRELEKVMKTILEMS